MKSYGALLEGIDLERIGKNKALVYIIVRALHKIVFVLSVMLFIEFPSISIILFTQNTVLFLSYFVWVKPLQQNTSNLLVILEEVVNMFVNYHLFFFTEWTGFEVKSQAGNSIIFFMLFQLSLFALINLGLLLGKYSDKFSLKNLRYLKLRAKKQRRKFKKKRKNTYIKI